MMEVIAAAPWAHSYALLDGVRLHYVTAGDGPLLLLLHGFPEFWYSWRLQIPVFARHYRVVAPDLRGYNLSSRPPGVMSYGIEHLVEDVHGLIEALGEKRAIVCGHDWGGAVAWTFAATRPAATECLIVGNCPHPQVLEKHLRRSWQQMRRSWYMAWFQLPWLPERLMLRDPLRFVRGVFRSTAARKDAFSDEDLRLYAEALARPGALTAALNYYRAAFRGILVQGPMRLSPIECPTLVVWGENDAALGLELSDDLDEYVAGPFSKRLIPDCSHWVQQDRPDEFNRHVLEFLEDVSSHQEADAHPGRGGETKTPRRP
jgi:pimeloyl-ACP methyl ester carboxylesterase